MNENEAKTLIERFAEKQQGGHFACPRCGKMAMDAESVTRNALSRRATVHICDACGTVEALEDMTGDRRPLTAWAIVSAPENWRMRRHYSAAAWAREQYTDRWNDCPYFRDMVERGEIPADYIGRRSKTPPCQYRMAAALSTSSQPMQAAPKYSVASPPAS